MPITFRCEHCGKEVQAPEGAGGKRGKCPHCGQSNYIPSPVSEEELIPVIEEDAAEQQRRQEEQEALLARDRDLLAGSGPTDSVPLDQRENLATEDLHHFVVNYCLDMAGGKLERAGTHVTQLQKFGDLGAAAVEDFLAGRASEDALNSLPKPVLEGYLKQLRSQVK